MYFKNLLGKSVVWRGVYFVSLLFVNIFLSRYLQAANAGWVFYLSSIFAFIQLIAGVCFETGITYYGSSGIISVNRLMWFALLWSVIATLVVSAALYIYFPEHTSGALQSNYFLFGVYYISGELLMIFSSALFYTQRNFLAPNLIMALFNLLFVAIIPAQHKADSFFSVNDILNIYFFLFVAQGVVMMIVFIIKNKSWREINMPLTNDLKKLTRYSIIALAANVIFFLVYRIDYWFVNNSPVCSKQDLGNYIQVSKLGQMLLVIPQIIASAVFPQMASGFDRAAVNKAVMILARLFLQLFAVLFLFILLAGNTFFTWVFGESFHQMQIPFLLLIPGIYFLAVLTILSAYFSGKGNVMINVKGATAALIVVVIADYFLVPVYGIYAAAAISTIGYGVNLSYSMSRFYKDYSIRLPDFFVWKKKDYNWLLQLLSKTKHNG